MNVLKVYICGPHSTGKTTLLHDVIPHLQGITVAEEVARGIIKSHGWSREDFLPEKHPQMFLQLNKEILEQQINLHAKYSKLGKDFISDRGIDPIVYCQFYLGDGAKSTLFKQIPELKTWLESLRSALVFLVTPHKECISDDNVRLSSTIEELEKLTEVFEAELKAHDIDYRKISQLDRKERVDIVLEEIKEIKPGSVKGNKIA